MNMRFRTPHPKTESRHAVGQAALLSVIFFLAASLALLFSFSSLALGTANGVRRDVQSRQSYYLAEAGIEDAAGRIVSGLPYAASGAVPLGNFSAAVQISGTTRKEILATGAVSNAIRKVRAILSTGRGATFAYGVQVDSGGVSMSNGSSIQGDVYSNGSIVNQSGNASITGDAIVAGGIGDDPTVSWSVDASSQEFATAVSDEDIAQSFGAPVSDRLNKISVYLAKVGNPGEDITLRVAEDDSGKPANSDLARTVISRTLVAASPSWIDAAFANPPALTAGRTYWIILDYEDHSAANHWIWRKDPSDGYAPYTGKTAPDWSKTSSSWTNVGGDLLFRAWIGGVSTKIANVTVGDAASGAARANLFENTAVHGSACPNPYCIIENPPRKELPISEGAIAAWKSEALALGGTCAPPVCDSGGNYFLGNGKTAALGPIKIPGDFEIDNNTAFTLSGTVWVAGDAVFDNNCHASLNPGYGENSGLIIVDGTVTVSNNCVFAGSGNPQSYLMILSDKNAPSGEVMDIRNGSEGVIYYAGRGRIRVSNNADVREITAYGLTLGNNVRIEYETGLADVNFSAGPRGGWNILGWSETK